MTQDISPTRARFDRLRFAVFLLAAVSGIVGGYFGQPWVHENDRAVEVIVTAFSILAGFLIAIMTIIGDPSSMGWRSWRSGENARKNVFGRLLRQKLLFHLYLATLGIIFIDSLLSKDFPAAGVWFERFYLGMAIAAFILSFRLPSTLMRIQLDRHDEAIESRRKNRQ